MKPRRQQPPALTPKQKRSLRAYEASLLDLLISVATGASRWRHVSPIARIVDDELRPAGERIGRRILARKGGTK